MENKKENLIAVWLKRLVELIKYYKHYPSFVKLKLSAGLQYDEYRKSIDLLDASVDCLRKQKHSQTYIDLENQTTYVGNMDLEQMHRFEQYVTHKDNHGK